MIKKFINFMGLSKGMGLATLLVLTLAFAFPAFSASESGASGAQAVSDAVEFRQRVVDSQQSDGTQPSPTRPPIEAGSSSPGGDVGDVVSEESYAPSPLWQRLEQLSAADKANAVIEIETGSDLSAAEEQATDNIDSLWNTGRFEDAMASLRTLEEAGLKLAVGISWKQPKETGASEWAATDVRIGARANIEETQLDFDAQNGNLFSVLSYDDGVGTDWYWSANISTDNGQTWQETYQWWASYEIKDVSAAVVDDYLYIGYVAGTTFIDARVRRCLVSNGSIDATFGSPTVFNKGVAINEIALVTNADDFDNRVYYWAILSDNSLIYYWASGVDTTSPVWSEIATGVTNAGQGLDATWNQSHPSGYYLHASYVASDGTNPVMVLRHADAVWEAISVLADHTGLYQTTSVSAYNDTVICMYEHSYTNGNGIRYNISYNGGTSWSYGTLADPPSGHAYYKPDVTARGGHGTACVFDDEAGAFDPVWFQFRSGYSSGPWTVLEQFNEFDGATAWPNRIEKLPLLAGSTYAFGATYISWDPDAGTAYFDRSDNAAGGDPIIRIEPTSLTINQSDSAAASGKGEFVPVVAGAKSAPQGEPMLGIIRSDESRLDVKLATAGMFVEEKVEGGDTYQAIHLGRYNGELPSGQPNLPAIRKHVYVPKGKSANFEVTLGNSVTFTNYLVYPTQLPQMDTKGAESPPFYRDEGVYGKDEWLPKDMVSLGPVEIMRGHAIRLLSICPFQYNPARKILRVFPEIDAQILFNGQEIDIDSRLRSPVFDKFVKGIVVNPGAFAEGEPGVEAYTGEDYLIITAPAFETQANALAAHKTGRGISTGVVTTAVTGTTSSQIKAYIQNMYDTYAPTYVLLLGDVETIPTTYDGTANTGTDLYYSTVDGSDYVADLFLGRISVDTVSEAQTVVNKIINYENNPPSSPSFYTNAALAAYFQDYGDYNGYEDRRFVRTSEEVRDFLMGEGYNVERIYYTEPGVTPTNYNNGTYGSGEALPAELLRANGFAWDGDAADISAAINAGVFLLMHRDHGMDRNDGYSHTGWGDPYYVETHIAALTNGELLPVVMSMNCQTGWFDGETDHHASYNYESFCELFLRKSGGGAVGVFGATRNSYSGHNDFMAEGMIDSIWPDFLPTVANASGASAQMGPMLNHGKLAMDQLWGDPWGVRQLEYELFHVFGDPSLEMYTDGNGGGNTFTIFNDGTADLEVTSMVKRDGDAWLSWTPTAPLTIPPGGSRVIAVNINWGQVSGSSDDERIIVYSNDPAPNKSPYPSAVYITANKSASSLGDELALDFGSSYGLWHYDGSSWSSLASWNPDGMVDWTGGLAVDFGASYGLWNYNGTIWSQLAGWNPENDMVNWNGGIAVDFATTGLWHYDGSSWSSLASWNPNGMAEWTGGLAVNFGAAYGLWNYDGTTWSQLAGWEAEGGIVWNSGLVIDFGTNGLWYYDGTSWTSLAGWDPDGMVDWTGGLAVDFDTYGTWNYDGTTWAQLAAWNPEDDMVNWNGGIAVDFGSNGLWRYDGSSWTSLASWNPEEMEGWANGLAVDFGASYGLWNYDGSSWSNLAGWDSEDMIDVDLY